jgi:hypothetical protein
VRNCRLAGFALDHVKLGLADDGAPVGSAFRFCGAQGRGLTEGFGGDITGFRKRFGLLAFARLIPNWWSRADLRIEILQALAVTMDRGGLLFEH